MLASLSNFNLKILACFWRKMIGFMTSKTLRVWLWFLGIRSVEKKGLKLVKTHHKKSSDIDHQKKRNICNTWAYGNRKRIHPRSAKPSCVADISNLRPCNSVITQGQSQTELAQYKKAICFFRPYPKMARPGENSTNIKVWWRTSLANYFGIKASIPFVWSATRLPLIDAKAPPTIRIKAITPTAEPHLSPGKTKAFKSINSLWCIVTASRKPNLTCFSLFR